MKWNKLFSHHHLHLIFIAGICFLGLLSAYVAFTYYNNEKHDVYEQAKENLQIVTNLKIQRIHAWREERLGDAQTLSHNFSFARDVQVFKKYPRKENLRHDVLTYLEWFRKSYNYKSILLIDQSGRVLLYTAQQKDTIGSHLAVEIPKIARSRSIYFSDLHTSAANPYVHLDLALPLLLPVDNDTLLAAIIVMRLDPLDDLYPLISQWPSSQKTAETYLCRVDDDSITFLSPLRFSAVEPGKLRIPVSPKSLHVSNRENDGKGFLEGIDYRGTDVIAYIRSVSGSPWILVSKIDRAEIQQPLTKEFLEILILEILIILSLSSIAGYLWIYQRNASYKKEARLKNLYAILSETNGAIVRLKDKESLFDEVCRIAVETGNMKASWVGTLDQSSRLIVPAAVNGIGKEELYSMHDGFRFIDNTRLCYQSIASRKPVILNDIGKGSARIESWRSFALARAFHSMAALPFFLHGTPVGVVVMFNKEPRFFGDEEIKLLDEISRDISFALETFESEQKKSEAERHLWESEKNYRQLTDFSPTGILVYADTIIVFANPAAAHLLGASDSQNLLGRNALDFVHPEFRNTVVNRNKKLAEGTSGAIMLEEKLIKLDGTVIYSEVTAIPFDYFGKKAVQVVFNDITKRKQAEEALNAERNLLQTIVYNLPVALYIKDKQGRKLISNPKDLENIGKSEREVIGKTDADIFPKEIAERTETDDMTVISGNTIVQNREELLINDNGEKKWLLTTKIPYKSKSGEIIGIIGMGLDITERKKSEEEIRILSRAIEQSPVSIMITNIKGDIEYVNPMFCKTSGYSFDEVYEKNPRILKSGETSPVVYKRMWESITSGKDWEGEFHNKTKSGDLYWEKVYVSPVKNESGTVSHFLAIKENITDKKAMQDQLLQAQKVESIGTLASGIAHDFNNVLGIILAHSGVINRWSGNKQLLENGLHEINKAVDRGANLVRQILTFARKSETTFKPMSVKEIIKDIISMLNQTFPKIITVDYHIEKNLPYITADRTKIHQAVMNLCVNARDAMPNGGVLTIAASLKPNEELPRKIQNDTYKMYMTIAVSDTGTGIEPKILNQIFDPFFTTKELGKGTGLGLSVVYGVVQTHKGMIDVQSEIGKGTTFTMYLPVQDEGVGVIEAEGGEDEEPPGGNETILLVEDELSLQEMVQEILMSRGYTVLAAGDGERAVDIFAEHSKEIRCVLTDMGLPKLTGVDVFKAIKKITPSVKVIFASGYYEPNVKSELWKAGASGFLDKPYQVIDVLRILREVLDDDKKKDPS